MTVDRTAIPSDAQKYQLFATVNEDVVDLQGPSLDSNLSESDKILEQHTVGALISPNSEAVTRQRSVPSGAVPFQKGASETTVEAVRHNRQKSAGPSHSHQNLTSSNIAVSNVVEYQTPDQVRSTSRSRNSKPSEHGVRLGSKKTRNETRRPNTNIRKQGVSKTRRKIPQGMQAQWRVGAAPSVALTLTKEERQVSKVLSQATAFHASMFETFWGPRMHDNQFIFDLDNRVELFRDSSVTAACLVAAGKPQSAQTVLNRVLPAMDDLLHNPHPQLYLIFAELSLGLVKTPNDAVRDQIVRHIASRALTILGAEHPLTVLLTLQLPQSRKEALGDRLWNVLLPLLAQKFGSDHYQSSTQVFCQARNMASCGRSEEAIKILEPLIARWGQIYGNNSLIVCYSKIELANILVAAGVNMKAEFVVSDALRTSDMIQAAELRNEDCNASEKRHRESSIAFPRVAGLRTLGKLHSQRGNLGAATYYYAQAVAIGSPSLGEKSAAVELAQSELESARELELRQTLEDFSLAESSNLTNIVPSPVC